MCGVDVAGAFAEAGAEIFEAFFVEGADAIGANKGCIECVRPSGVEIAGASVERGFGVKVPTCLGEVLVAFHSLCEAICACGFVLGVGWGVFDGLAVFKSLNGFVEFGGFRGTGSPELGEFETGCVKGVVRLLRALRKSWCKGSDCCLYRLGDSLSDQGGEIRWYSLLLRWRL